MIRTAHVPAHHGAERRALRRRIDRMYQYFNREHWEKCYDLLDPRLRNQSQVDEKTYATQLAAFKRAYGTIKPWHIRVSLHLRERRSKQEDRPFAYVYIVWQDEAHAFHMFRERWVKHEGRWFTRVAGLVANKQASNGNGMDA